MSGLPPCTRSLVHESTDRRRRRHPEHACGRVGVARREELRDDVEATIDSPEHVLVGDETGIENEFGVVGKPLAHLVFNMPGRETGRAAFDDEAGAPLVEALVGVRLRKEQIQSRPVSVGDEPLSSVDDPPAALPDRGGDEAGWLIGNDVVRRGLRLRHADRHECAPIVAQLWQKPCALVVGCRRLERLNQLQRLREDDRHPHVAFRELLNDHGGREAIGARASVLGQQRQRSQSAVATCLDNVPGEAVLRGDVPIQAGRDGRDDLCGELPGDIHGSVGGRPPLLSLTRVKRHLYRCPLMPENDLHAAVGITFEHSERVPKL